MFTKNYYTYKRETFRISSYSSPNFTNALTNILGTEVKPNAVYAYAADLGGMGASDMLTSMPSTDGKNSYNCGMAIGSGTTKPTLDDYTMESMYTSSHYSYRSAGTALFEESDGQYVFEIRNEVTNITAEDLTINELGIFRSVGTTNTTYYRILMCRDVLDEPIVIAPGETRLVTYRINFNQTLV